MDDGIGRLGQIGHETYGPRRRFAIVMTPQELRKNAEDCLKLAQETDEIYAKMALIEMATEFRVMAERLEWKATRRTADRIRQRVNTVLRGRRSV
jgi:hypothetical protein